MLPWLNGSEFHAGCWAWMKAFDDTLCILVSFSMAVVSKYGEDQFFINIFSFWGNP